MLKVGGRIGRNGQKRLRTILMHAASHSAIIYNGNMHDPTDAAWLEQAEDHMAAYETLAGGTVLIMSSSSLGRSIRTTCCPKPILPSLPG